MTSQALVPAARERRSNNLMVTAMYTSGAWAWAGLPGAELLADKDAERVFGVTNAVLGFGRLFRRPDLRHGLVQRHVMIDRAVADAGTGHVLELAAGLSRRGAHVSSDPAVRYTEVDIDLVLARKRALLARTDAGRAVLARPNLQLVDGDLREVDLGAIQAAPAGAPLTVVAEGLLMYLSAEAQRDLFRRVRALLDAGGVFLFDLVPPAELPPRIAVGRALGWIVRRITRGGAFVRDGRTRSDVVADLVAAGFDVSVLEPATAPARWDVPHLRRHTQQVVFCASVTSGTRTFVAPDAHAAANAAVRAA